MTEMDERVTFYVSIGNSDDKLTQVQWSSFVADVGIIVKTFAETIHGQWLSSPDSRWQNACWCFEAGTREVFAMRQHLRVTAYRYSQDSIAWAMCPATELLEPLSLSPGELRGGIVAEAQPRDEEPYCGRCDVFGHTADILHAGDEGVME